MQLKKRARSVKKSVRRSKARQPAEKPSTPTHLEHIQNVEEPREYTCFVAMPFDKDADRILKEGIQASADILKDANIRVLFDRADYRLKDLKLWDNIRKKIQIADFLIADISHGNPNVLYELGYARALEKRAIHITRTPKVSLADLQGWYYIRYSLLGLREFASLLSRYIMDVTNIVDARVQLEEFSIHAYRHRRAVDIAGLIENARESIDIYTTNVSDFLTQKYATSLSRTLREHPALQVRVLTMDPESDLVSRRALQLNINTYTYRKELRENLKKLDIIGREFSDHFSVRLYDDLPTQITFRFDRKVVTAVVSTVTRSRRNIHFLLDTQQAGVTESFIYHFEVIWGRADAVPQYMLT